MLRIIGIVTITLWLGLSSMAFAAVPRGVVTGDNAGSFIILRDGEQIPCQKGEYLYDGDIVKGDDVSSLTVEWHPYAKTQMISSKELKVRYEAPGTIDVAIYKMKEFLGLVDTEVTVQYGATRGGETKSSKDNLYPLPGFHATIMPGEKVTLAWGEVRGKQLIIKDSKNKVMKSMDVSGVKQVELTVEELGLVPGENYTWQVAGTYDQYKMQLLDTTLLAKIKSDLQSIDETVTNQNDRLLHKAVYLQLVSDASPAQIELYWLSYQMLVAIDSGDDAHLKAKVDRLKANVVDHISGMR